MKILGIDPGIKHTGLGVVESTNGNYALRESRLIRTDASTPEVERLITIYEGVFEILDEYGDMGVFSELEAVAIERVFHNENVSSSISTGKAIGACMVAIGQFHLPVIALTPQQIKKASGLTMKHADKDNLKKMASRIFKEKITNHHIADAAFCALAGLLKRRTIGK